MRRCVNDYKADIMRCIPLLWLCFVLFVSCQNDIDSNAPDCVKHRTRSFRSECCDSGASVKEYIFQGQNVYVYDPGDCGADMTSEVTDETCTTLGYLGGITGNTIINGEDFSLAQFERLIWKN